MRVLILGGAGLIGTELGVLLTRDGHDVTVADSFRSSDAMAERRRRAYRRRLATLAERCDVVRADVRDERAVGELVARSSPDVVVYLAALLASDSEKAPDEARDIHLGGLTHAVRALEARRTPFRIVSASSSFVYGDFVHEPADEQHRLSPAGVYGRTKADAEAFLREREWSHGRWMILRPSSVYGIGDPRERFASVAVEQAVLDGAFTCALPGYISDFTYVADVARAFALAAGDRFTNGATVNVTRGQAWTTEQFCEVLREEVPGTGYTVEPLEGRPPRRGALDSRRAAELLGWVADHDLRRGVRASVTAVRELFGDPMDSGLTRDGR